MAVETIDFPLSGTSHRSEGPDAIPFAATTVAAFLGRAERGPVNEPVPLQSFDEYRRHFGGHCPFSHLAHAVQHFFLNGGESAVVVRIVNRATRATIEVPAGSEILRLQARRPGSRELLRVSVDYEKVDDDPDRFNLVVQRLSRLGSHLIEDQELFPALSMSSTDRRFVVDVLQESELISLSGPLPSCRPDATKAEHPGQAIPYVDMAKAGTDGEELTDYDLVGSNEEGTGLFALDRIEQVDLLCMPPPPSRDLGSTAFLAAERYCERRRAMLIWDPSRSWPTADAALLGTRAAGLAGRNALTYFPRIRPRAEFARYPEGLPACGALAGMLARGDADRAAGTRNPPLVLKASLTTATDVAEKQASMLHRYGVNTLVREQGGSVGLRGNVCLAAQDRVSTLWQRLDARRTALSVLSAVERGTLWVSKDLYDPITAERLERQVREYLAHLHDREMLVGQRSAEAFFVRVSCPDEDQEPVVTLRFGFALLRPGHFLIYEIAYREDGRTTREVPPLDAEQLAG